MALVDVVREDNSQKEQIQLTETRVRSAPILPRGINRVVRYSRYGIGAVILAGCIGFIRVGAQESTNENPSVSETVEDDIAPVVVEEIDIPVIVPPITPGPSVTQTPRPIEIPVPRLVDRVLFDSPVGVSGGSRFGSPNWEYIRPPFTINSDATEFRIKVALVRMQGPAGYNIQNTVPGADPRSRALSIGMGETRDFWTASYWEFGNQYPVALPYSGTEGNIEVRFNRLATEATVITPNGERSVDLRGSSLFLPGQRDLGIALWSYAPNGQVTAIKGELSETISP